MTDKEVVQFLLKPRNEINAMADSGAFNSIIAGYVAGTLKAMGKDKDEIQEALHTLAGLFETMDATQAREIEKQY